MLIRLFNYFIVNTKAKALYSSPLFTTVMLKQISAKSIDNKSVKQLYDESIKYLENIGFSKEPLLSVTDRNRVYRSFVFRHGKEKVLLELNKDEFEETIKLIFAPMNIEFVHDILLMRFNQVARQESGRIFVYNN